MNQVNTKDLTALREQVAKMAGIAGVQPCKHCNGHGGTYYDGSKEFVQDCHYCNYTGMTGIDLLAPENLHLLMDAVEKWCKKQDYCEGLYIGFLIDDSQKPEATLAIYNNYEPSKVFIMTGETKSIALARAWVKAAENTKGETNVSN